MPEPHSTHSLSNSPIGLFDSGIGGLTVLRELKRALPREHFVYLGDTARTPYGSKGPETIRRYSSECASFLLQHEIKILIVACNTASSVALDDLKTSSPCPVIGTIDPAVRCALRETRGNRIGVIGTEATIASGTYETKLHEMNPRVQVFSQACPLFVPLVEQGMVSGEIVEKVIDLYLASLREKEIDTLILACTHYPLLAEQFSRYFTGDVKIIECSKAIAEEVALLLDESGMRRGREDGSVAADRYYATDDVRRFDRLAGLFLGGNGVEAVRVEELRY